MAKVFKASYTIPQALSQSDEGYPPEQSEALVRCRPGLHFGQEDNPHLIGSELKRMEEIFLLSSQYEYMFWDSAYRMEEWPV